MISRNVGKKESAATSEIKRFKNKLDLIDKDSITPRREFEDGKVVGLSLFPSVVLHQQANTLGMMIASPDSDQCRMSLDTYAFCSAYSPPPTPASAPANVNATSLKRCTG